MFGLYEKAGTARTLPAPVILVWLRQLKVGECRHSKTFEIAFLAQHIQHGSSIGAGFCIAEHVDHIAKVARPGSLSKRLHTFAE